MHMHKAATCIPLTEYADKKFASQRHTMYLLFKKYSCENRNGVNEQNKHNTNKERD